MKKYFWYIIFLIFSTVAMQEDRLITTHNPLPDSITDWPQLSKHLNAIPTDTQLEITNELCKIYPHDSVKKSFLVSCKTVPPKLSYIMRDSSPINFDFYDRNGKHITCTFPFAFEEGNNTIIGPNNSNHIIINDVLFDTEHNVMHNLAFEDSEKPVALHPSQKTVCTYFYRPEERQDHIYLKIHNQQSNFNPILLNYSFDNKSFYPDQYRVFFGPDKKFPTLWIRRNKNEVALYKYSSEETKSTHYFHADEPMVFSDYFCCSDNPKYLITFSDNKAKLKKVNENSYDQISLCYRKSADTKSYINNDLNALDIAPHFYIGSPYMIPRVIIKAGNQLTEVDNKLPAHRVYILKEKKIDTKLFFLRQMHAFVLYKALKQLSRKSYISSTEEEKTFVKLMRANPDKYKIILHAQQINIDGSIKEDLWVKSFLKVLQKEYTEKKL